MTFAIPRLIPMCRSMTLRATSFTAMVTALQQAKAAPCTRLVFWSPVLMLVTTSSASAVGMATQVLTKWRAPLKPLLTATATVWMMLRNSTQPPTVMTTACWMNAKTKQTVMPTAFLTFVKVAVWPMTPLLVQLPLTSMADWPQGLLLVQLKKTLGPVMDQVDSLLEPDLMSSTAFLFLNWAN